LVSFVSYFFNPPRRNNRSPNHRVYPDPRSAHGGARCSPGRRAGPPLRQIPDRTRVRHINGASWRWGLAGLFAFACSDIIKPGEQLPKAGQLGAAPQQSSPQSDWVPRDGCPGLSPAPQRYLRGRQGPLSGGEEGSWAGEGGKWPFWGAGGAGTHSPRSCRGRGQREGAAPGHRGWQRRGGRGRN